MEIAQHIASVAHEGELLAEAAKQADIETDVDTCPGWNMRDLVRHLSEIHLWAAARIAKRTSKLWPDDISEHTESWPELAVFWPDDADLVDWYLKTNANLVQALEAATPTDDIPTFLPAPSPLAMWARRQAHETAVHRFDAENAIGVVSGFDSVFAADGIDELLAAFAPRKQSFPIEDHQAMHVHAVDEDAHWLVTLGPDGIETSHSEGSADVTLSGAAADLYLVLWNRADDATVEVTGDRELLDKWHGNHRIRWS